MDTLTYPAGEFEARTYDGDGGLIRDVISGSFGYFRDALLKYDARQKVLYQANTFNVRDTLTAAYSGLGHLLNSQLTGWGRNNAGAQVRVTSYDTLSNDALGNLIQTSYTKTDSSASWDRATRARSDCYQAGTGRSVYAANWGQGVRDTVVYDSAGNTRGTWQVVSSGATTGLQDRLSYYAADGLVRAADYRQADGPPNQTGPIRFVFEEYRYDAYGRRIWVRARRNCYVSYSTDPRPQGECKVNLVRRTVWDGFQELAEIQQPGGDADPVENDTQTLRLPAPPDGIDQNPFFGRVLYTNGIVVDQPLSLTRLGYADSTAYETPQTPQPWVAFQPFSLLPFWNYLGEADHAMVSSTACKTVNGVLRCFIDAWPFGWNALKLPEFTPYFWHGTVTEGKRDKAQTLYRRNRAYDPATGRFTQEDPIGLAGGLNLYGYAGGDPINFSDPFGLCQEGTKEKPCKTRDEAARQGMRKIEKRSVKQDREYSGEIVKLGPGRYEYTAPQRGDQASSPVDTHVSDYDGYYHSHGANDPQYDNEHFSGCTAPDTCDKSIADDTGKPGYVVTPSGRMLRYDPDPKKKQQGNVTQIGQTTP